MALPAWAEDFNPDDDNRELLRDDSSGCETCLAAPPHEWDQLPFDLDWSLALRAAIVNGPSGAGHEAIAVPKVTLTQRTLRGGYDLGLEGEVTYNGDGTVRVNALRLTAGGDYALDAVTTATGRANLDFSQDAADDPDLPANVLSAPLVISGDAVASVSRKMGNFEFTLRGSAGRSVTGQTKFVDLSTSDNSDRNTTNFGAGGRIAVGLTPNLQAFIDADAVEELYDTISPSLLVKLDNLTTAGRVGLKTKWGEVLELEGSLGLAYRDFAEPVLGDVVAALYDAQLTFRPNETVTLGAAFTTTLSSPGSSSAATARLEYAAKADASYQVNTWLRLRASAGWSYAELIGTPSVDTGYSLGSGADYLLNEHTDLTADYKFTRSEVTPDPAEDEHRFEVGITFHR